MAKQAGGFTLEGRFDELCFYQIKGTYYVRRKSSLTGKRFKKDVAFERSRQSALRFAEGNKVASEMYRLIPKENRSYALFCFLKKKSISLLKEGKNAVSVRALLTDYLISIGFLTKPLIPKKKIKKIRPASALTTIKFNDQVQDSTPGLCKILFSPPILSFDALLPPHDSLPPPT